MRYFALISLIIGLMGCGDDGMTTPMMDGGTTPMMDGGAVETMGTPIAGTSLMDVDGTPSATGFVQIVDVGGEIHALIDSDFVSAMGPGDTELRFARADTNLGDQMSADASSVSAAVGIIANGSMGTAYDFVVPSSIDLSDLQYAVIWCPTASLNFGVGQLAGRVATLEDVDGTPSATGSVRMAPNASGGFTLTLGADFVQAMGPGDTEVRLAMGSGNVAEQMSASADSVTAPLAIIPNAATGTQTIEIPASIDVADFSYVIIWCPTASVNFGVGELSSFAGMTPTPIVATSFAGRLVAVEGSPGASGGVTIAPNEATGGHTIVFTGDFMQGEGPGDTEVRLAMGMGNLAEQIAADASSVTAALGIITNGATGMQTVEVPAEIDVADFSYLVVWCPTASINFGVAELAELDTGDGRRAAIMPVEGSPMASGSAIIAPAAGGGYTLTLGDDFMQGEGPGDTEVRLAAGMGNLVTQMEADPDSVSAALGIVANGASGMQTITIPAEVDLADFSYVVIWCPTASINFGVGELVAF